MTTIENKMSSVDPARHDVRENQFGEILGEVFWLTGRSEQLRLKPLGEVYDSVVAAIQARTFRLYRKDSAPLAFLTWGLLDEKQEARFRSGAHLTAEELRSGDRAWIILAATPFVSADTVIQELRKSDFSNRPLMTMI